MEVLLAEGRTPEVLRAPIWISMGREPEVMSIGFLGAATPVVSGVKPAAPLVLGHLGATC